MIDRYLNAIAKEISSLPQRFEIDTIYLGGGTPSHLSPSQLWQLKSAIDQRLDLADGVEFTAECNPADLDEEKAGALASIGVNRISLGVQSLRQEKLEQLERDHDSRTVETATEIARRHFRSLSIDLIFAANGESLEQWSTDLNHAIALAPDHFSTYELTYEKGTRFWNRLNRSELVESGEDLRAEMYLAAMDRLTTAGWEHYEISSFAKPGHRSRHNQVYWSGRPYFAFGPGAARFIGGVRETNHASPLVYLRRIESGEDPVAQREELSPEMQARELLAIGLRRLEGVDLHEFEKLTSFSATRLAEPFMRRYESAQLLQIDHDRIRLTARGILMADQISIELIGG